MTRLSRGWNPTGRHGRASAARAVPRSGAGRARNGRCIVLTALAVAALGAVMAAPAAAATPQGAEPGAADGVARAASSPGSPGTPQAPTVLYDEGFENGPIPNGSELLSSYTGAPPLDMTYTADPAWLSFTECNGVILNSQSPAPSSTCGQSGWENVQDLAFVAGLAAGETDAEAATNHAVAAWTRTKSPPADSVMFETGMPISLSGSGKRFVTFSVDVAATNCVLAAPDYEFYLASGGSLTPLFSSGIDPCATVPNAHSYTHDGISFRAGSFAGNKAILFQGSQLGIVLKDASTATNGNDAAFDNVKVLDVTPQLDQSFSPASVPVGSTSTLTITVTNTSELAEKDGFGFTDPLPAGLTIADSGATSTCGGTLSAAQGASSVKLTGGDLAAGAADCTITVHVTSSDPGTYTDEATSFTLDGLDAPADASVTFVPVSGVPWVEPGALAGLAVVLAGFVVVRRRRRGQLDG